MGTQQNPYYDTTFFGFFITFIRRLFSGEFEVLNLAPDELQVVILSLIAISAALVGTFLYLRKITMLANALSHTILAGVVLAYLAHSYFGLEGQNYDFSHLLPNETLLFASALLMAFLTTFFTQLLISKVKLKEDASCAIVFTFLFAFGVILVTALSKNAHIGAELLMGNADALHQDDLSLQIKVTLFNLILITLCYRGFFVTTFDPVFSSILGISPTRFGYLLMALVAITTIGAFRAVGVLLVLAFFIGPPLIARLYVTRLIPLIILAACIGVISSFIAVALARHLLSEFALPVSTSALTVSVIAAFYGASLLYKRFIPVMALKKSISQMSS
jgi:manganese/zinc/iron transport system permease protein